MAEQPSNQGIIMSGGSINVGALAVGDQAQAHSHAPATAPGQSAPAPASPKLQELHAALLAAFPSEADLRQMVRFGLDENLATIAGGDDLRAVVFNLVIWAEANGKLGELVAAARQANPGNPQLRAIVT